MRYYKANDVERLPCGVLLSAFSRSTPPKWKTGVLIAAQMFAEGHFLSPRCTRASLKLICDRSTSFFTFVPPAWPTVSTRLLVSLNYAVSCRGGRN